MNDFSFLINITEYMIVLLSLFIISLWSGVGGLTRIQSLIYDER